MLKKVEIIFRSLLMWFCSFSFLYALYVTVSPTLHLPPKNPFIILLLVLVGLPIAMMLKAELKAIFDDEWDWNPPKLLHRIQNDFFLLVGVGVLYYMAQIGAMVLFFPQFENVRFLEFKAYQIVFAAVSIIAFSFYKHLIIPSKKELTKF